MESKIRVRPGHQQLKQRLVRKIRTMPVGSRLPSVRKLMAQHGLSMTTVSRAVESLKQEGYVESQWGKGLFVAGDGQSVQARIIDAFVFGSPQILAPAGGFHADLMEHLGRRLGEDSCSLRTTLLPVDAPRQEALDRINELATRAVLLVNCNDPGLPGNLQADGIPCVAILPD